MPYLVCPWGGDYHHILQDSYEFDEWEDAQTFMQVSVEAGMQCNVIHTDFIVPEEKIDEMINHLKDIL